MVCMVCYVRYGMVCWLLCSLSLIVFCSAACIASNHQSFHHPQVLKGLSRLATDFLSFDRLVEARNNQRARPKPSLLFTLPLYALHRYNSGLAKEAMGDENEAMEDSARMMTPAAHLNIIQTSSSLSSRLDSLEFLLSLMAISTDAGANATEVKDVPLPLKKRIVRTVLSLYIKGYNGKERVWRNQLVTFIRALLQDLNSKDGLCGEIMETLQTYVDVRTKEPEKTLLFLADLIRLCLGSMARGNLNITDTSELEANEHMVNFVIMHGNVVEEISKRWDGRTSKSSGKLRIFLDPNDKEVTMLIPLYLSILTKQASFGAAVGMISTAKGLDAYARKAILDYVLKFILPSKSPPNDFVTAQYSLLLSSLSVEEWGELSVALGKMIKKSPESAAAATLTILKNLKTDITEFVRETLLSTCGRMIKSASCHVRAKAIQIVKVCAERTSDPAVLSSLLLSFLDAYMGKVAGTSLVQAYQRVAVLHALKEVASVLANGVTIGEEFRNSVCCSVIKNIIAVAEKEADSSVKPYAFSCVGRWIPLALSDDFSKVEFLKKGLDGAKTKGIFLQCIAEMLGNTPDAHGTCKELLPLVPYLKNTVNEAIKRVSPTGDADPVISLRILLQMAIETPSVLDDVNLMKVFEPGSFLCHPGIMALLQVRGSAGLDTDEVKYSIKDVLADCIVHIFADVARLGAKEAQSILFESVESGKNRRSAQTARHALSSSGQGEIIKPADIVLAAILFSSPTIRTNYGASLRYLSGNCPFFIESLVSSFSNLLFSLEEIPTHKRDFQAESSNSGEGACGLLKSIPPSSCMEKVITLLMGSRDRTLESKVHSLLVICSTYVCPCSDRATALFSKCINGDDDIKEMLVLSMADAITASLTSESRATQLKGVTAMKVLINLSKTAAVEFLNVEVLHRLMLTIKNKEYQGYTEEQMDMFLHPEKLAALSAGPIIDPSQITITNADRAGKRGKFGGDFQEDDQWIEQIKKEKLKKLQEAATAKMSESTKKAVNEILTSNAQIKHALGLLSFAMVGIQSIANLRLIAKDNLSELLQAVMDLIRMPIYSDVALETLTCLCRPYSSLASDIAASLRTVSIVIQAPLKKGESMQQRFNNLTYLSGPIVRVVRELHVNLVRGKAFSEEMMHIVYPIIQGIFSMPHIVPDCEYAFSVLEMGWMSSFSAKSPTLVHLKFAVLEVCLKVLANFRVEHANPERFFVWVMRNGPVEWGPVLSDLGVLSPSTRVKLTCLRAVQALMEDGLRVEKLSIDAVISLWLLRFDVDEGLAETTSALWTEKQLSLSPSFNDLLIPLLEHNEMSVRRSAAKALIEGVVVFPETCAEVLEALKNVFLRSLPQEVSPEASLPALPASIDGGGKKVKISMSEAIGAVSSRPSSKPQDTGKSARHAVALAFIETGSKKCISMNIDSTMNSLLDFIVVEGVVDSDSTVQSTMLEAGRSVIDAYGQGVISTVLAFLNSVINRKPAKDEDMKKYDLRHEATVILLGAAGKHLSKDDPNILSITDSMLEALKTPSDSVQRAVADSLVGLVGVLKGSEIVKKQLEDMMTQTVEGKSYGDRRGAALGLAAYVKGLGIPCLKQHDIVTRLKDMCESGSVSNREGALFAFECLSGRLGLLFEPYIISIMPVLLKSFSHSSDHVREAAQDAAKIIMAKLSAHGVKQVLTPLLTSLPTETAWKSRQEAIRLLGTMAYCAPRQLAACLPQIIPRLVDAVADPHPKVKESARNAMGDISSVIKNPEVASLSPTLIAALGDPANKTKDALAALLNCEFMHSIDAPSLGVLIPILGRALKDRSADLKRKSAAITGNICSMITDPKIIIPYFPQMLPGLKECLVDPIPDVRATSAKALGSLMVGVGEEELSELVPWLLETISSEVSPVERSGAAQGLAEVSLSLNASRRLEILTAVIGLQGNTKVAAREGMVWCLSFFPSVLGEQYAQYISFTLPIVLQGLCDDNDGVREVALRAGQVMVSVLGSTHTHELLPGLSEGLFDDDWRIRLCSVSLLGDLLYLVGDTRAAGMTDVDDDMGSSGSSRASLAIRAHIGDEDTNNVLAALYIARSDTSTGVRQGALQVWKTVVYNSPKTLKEVMPSLLDLLVEKLASPSAEMRAIAGKALGDIVTRMGDQVLPVIVPQLQKSLHEDDQSKREGIALGLTEILNCSSAVQIGAFLEFLVPALQKALCDSVAEVRQQAALAFQTMQRSIGEKAVISVVTPLLTLIVKNAEDDKALLGLQEIVKQKPRELLEFLLPRLLKSPMTAMNANILGTVIPSAGLQLNFHLSMIIPNIIPELAHSLEDDHETRDDGEVSLHDHIKECASAIMGSVSTGGVHYLLDELGVQIEDLKDPARRRWGCWLLEQFIVSSSATIDDYIRVILKYLLGRVTDFNNDVLVATNAALTALTRKVLPEIMVTNLEFIIICFQSAASEVKHRAGTEAQFNAAGDLILPLFTVPKALDSVLPVFLHGLMNGSATVRETAADGITELISLCEPIMLKPFLIKTTGPLIRVAGDRFPSSVKAAILRTLSVLLEKDVTSLKAFAPQLQTTFVKSLGDPTKQVRSRAVTGLGLLMTVTTRVDTLLGELAQQFIQAEGNSIKTSIFEAMRTVLTNGGSKCTSVGSDKAKTALLAGLGEEDEGVRSAAGSCVKALSFFFDEDQVGAFISDLTSSRNIGNVGTVLGYGAVISTAAENSNSSRANALSAIKRSLQSTSAIERSSACKATGFIFNFPVEMGEISESKKDALMSCVSEASVELLDLVCNLGKDENVDVRKQAIVAIKHLCKDYFDVANKNIVKCMTPLVDAVKDVNIRIKSIADRAMKYLLRGATNQETINKYAAQVDGVTAGFVKDHAKKVLSKLPYESDDEEVGDFFTM